MKYKYILFDLDGTLTDPLIGITNSVMYALDKYNLNVKNREELIPFIGPPLIDSFQEYSHLTLAQARQAVVYYREYFSDKGKYENAVYEGIEELLKRLCSQGYQLYIATSKPEVFAKEILQHFHLDHYFTYIAGSSLDESRNRKGDVIKYALETNKITNLQEVLMVGDRKHDVIGAKENNIDCLGVLFGYGSLAELQEAGANYVVASVQELQAFLCK